MIHAIDTSIIQSIASLRFSISQSHPSNEPRNRHGAKRMILVRKAHTLRWHKVSIMRSITRVALIASVTLARCSFADAQSVGPQVFDDELKLWPDLKHVERVMNRQPLQAFSTIESLAWADGSRTLLVGDRAGIAAWDVKSGKLLHRLRSAALNYNVALTSRDGKRVITSGDYRPTTIRAWPGLKETPPQKNNAAFKLGFCMRYRVALSDDGKYLAQLVSKHSGEAALRLLDCDSGELLFERENRHIRAMTWDPQNRFLVVGEERGTVIFLTLENELIRRGIRLEPVEKPIALSVSPDGNWLMVSTWHSVAMYAIKGRRKVWRRAFNVAGAPVRVMNASFTADGREIIALVHDDDVGSKLLAMDANSGETRVTQRISTHYDSSMALSPDGKLIATVGTENNVILCDARSLKPVVLGDDDSEWDRLNIVGNSIFRNRLFGSPSGEEVLATGFNQATLWDVHTGDKIWSIVGQYWFEGADWNSTAEWIVAVTRTNVDPDRLAATLQFLDPADGRVFREVELPGARGHSVKVLSDDRILVTARKDLFLREPDGTKVWDTTFEDEFNNRVMAVSPDESIAAVVRWRDKSNYTPINSHIKLVDLKTGRTIRQLDAFTSPVQVAFCADGSRVLASTTNHYKQRGEVQMMLDEWDTRTGKRINNSHVPDDPKFGEDYVRASTPEELSAILERSPLLADDNRRLTGQLAMHPKRKQFVIAKPISYQREADEGVPRWSNRLLLWDAERNQSIREFVLPGGIWDVVYLRNKKIVTINNNRTLFVIDGSH